MATRGHGRRATGEPDGALSRSGWPETLTRWLDDGFRIPGTELRVGLDPVLGLLVPGLGDALTALVAVSLVHEGLRNGVPKAVLARMVLNVGVDAVLGAVPVVGDLFDFGWKANRKNMNLLERHRGAGGSRAGAADYAVLGGAVLALIAVVAVPIAVGIALGAWLLRPE